LKRNSSIRGYSATPAQEYANERKERFKRKRKFRESIRKYIVARPEEEQWSAVQIVRDAKVRGPMVSIERIYQYIRQNKRSDGMLWKYCHHRLKLQRIAKMLKTQFYFVHPYSSWERGLNKYTNGLIRQYISKKLPLCTVSDQEVNNIHRKINRRTGKNLNFDTPVKLFFERIRI
jgi:IS30 family transposase